MLLKQREELWKEPRHIWENKHPWLGLLFLAPSLLGLSVFVLLPFCDVIRRSFSETMSGRFVGWQNYKTVLSNGSFQMAALNTGKFIAVCIPLLLVISLLLALLVRKQPVGGNFFKTTFLIPMAIPVASVALLWKVFFHDNGMFNSLLELLGRTGRDWINSDGAFYVLVFSYIWKNAGYDMILYLAGLSGIPSSLYEAAELDGAGSLAQLRYITMPQLLPTLFIITVISLLNSFKVFREAYLITGEYPNEKIYMLQHLFNNWFLDLDVQKMTAAAVLMALCVAIIIGVLQRLWANKG